MVLERVMDGTRIRTKIYARIDALVDAGLGMVFFATFVLQPAVAALAILLYPARVVLLLRCPRT